MKEKVHMQDGTMPDANSRGWQPFLMEHGLQKEAKLNAQCKGFKCAPGATSCCCHCVLYNQLDFKTKKSLLEKACKARGFHAMFRPKFHCKLNFLEQCWGTSKHIYCMNPVSSKEEDLKHNIIAGLDSISLNVMQKYVFIIILKINLVSNAFT
ncbi:hypothetical protein MVEN_02169000 [Mycena venus]|uniref:Uncharacterized protein n=1 Tax=Mycena venus TaxID=2733690 RepID=A0A8H6X860_9AGAR|nr:hypothetical protein MVEN_02169000 [Mycena venus]